MTQVATPAAGPYGAFVTITGANFGDAGVLELASGSGVMNVSSSYFRADAGELWRGDRIVFRYPFPAEGGITVKGPGGQASAGAYTPAWVPGTPVNQAQDVYTPFPQTLPVSPGRVAAVVRYPDPVGAFTFGGYGVMLHNGVSPQLFRLQPPAPYVAVLSVSLFATDAGYPGGVALATNQASTDGGTDGGVLRSVMQLRWDGGLPVLVPTGFVARRALGAGTDATGYFAWAQATDGGLVRLRPGGPGFAVDRTMVPPAGFGGTTTQIFFLGNTLVAQWTVGRSTGFPFYKYYEHPVFALANGTAWQASERSQGEIDGYLDGVNVSTTPDGKLSVVYTGGYSTALLQAVYSARAEVRRPTGGLLSTPRPVNGSSGFVLAPTATDYAGAGCDATGLRVVRPVPGPLDAGYVPSDAGEVAIWPCPLLSWQLLLDADGGMMPLVEAGGRLYLVRKR